MKHQQVNVDFWAMGKAMLTYGMLTAVGWVMLRLFHSVFTLPRRLRAQQDAIKNTIKEMQERFPDLNLTEEELMNADEELDKFVKEYEEEQQNKNKEEQTDTSDSNPKALEDTAPKETETKKTL